MLSNITLFLLGVFCPFCIFSVILLSKICEDEKPNYNNFIFISKICILIMTITTLFIYENFTLMGILLIGYFIVELLISHKISFSELKKYYFLRSLNYIILYTLLLTSPLLLIFPISYEFFRLSFQKFKLRFEILLFVGYVLTLVFVFLL